MNDLERGIDYFNKKDFENAFVVFRPLAQQDNPKALSYLSYMYETGSGVIKNEREASKLRKLSIKFYKKEAKKGNLDIQYQLALYYREGIGVKVDQKKEIMWLTLAATKGHSEAQFDLSCIYFQNTNKKNKHENVIKLDFSNLTESIKWLKLSANKCFPLAMYNLGQMYRNGYGLKVNYIFALKWLNVSLIKFKACNELEMASLAVDYIRLVKSKMSTVQILKSQNLVNEFISKNQDLMKKKHEQINLVSAY